jgi:hypothetical protein
VPSAGAVSSVDSLVTLGRPTVLSAARNFSNVFTGVNKSTQTRRAKETGTADQPDPAPEMRSMQMTEKPARVVGDSNARIIVDAQHSRTLPPHPMHYPEGGKGQR